MRFPGRHAGSPTRSAGAGESKRSFSRSRKRDDSRQYVTQYPQNLNSRPTFKVWLKETWVDILTILCIGAVAFGFDRLQPPYQRLFAIQYVNGEIDSRELAYPQRRPILNSAVAGIIVFIVPELVILAFQIRIRSFWDVNNATIGLIYTLISGSCFQVIIKALIGGFRPHFLSVCDPDPAIIAEAGAGLGYHSAYFDSTICRGDPAKIKNARISFPSGHTEAAFAGFGFLYLYLNAKLKIWSNYQPRYWKIVLAYIPILGAVLIAGNLVITYNHHWYDCVAGAIIGIVFALSCYRAVYASIWDFRFNHIPLNRHVRFRYAPDDEGFASFHDSMWTRKAQWGDPYAFGASGAPFDSAPAMEGALVNDRRRTSH